MKRYLEAAASRQSLKTTNKIAQRASLGRQRKYVSLAEGEQQNERGFVRRLQRRSVRLQSTQRSSLGYIVCRRWRRDRTFNYDLRSSMALLLVVLMIVVPIAIAQSSSKPKFYPDDPLLVSPPPVPASKVKSRKLDDLYDYLLNDFGKPGEHWKKAEQAIPAKNVNTLGEVPDDEWYVARHYFKPMTLEQIVTGPNVTGPPAKDGQWKVVAAKTEGITPGFTILDARGKRYIVKFDPKNFPELATAPDVIGSKLFYALGYHVPENYIVNFRREDLVIGEDTLITDDKGKKRQMTKQDIGQLLMSVRQNEDGSYRAVASLFITGKPVGPHRYHGTRRDDPNDVVPHEHRRDLRGLRVFCAWLAHDDSRAINSLDMLDQKDGKPFVKHYLIDFGSILGSASSGLNSPRSGFVPFFNWSDAAKQFFSLGLYVPNWARAKYPPYPSVGRFEYEKFVPEMWTPEYFNPAFANMLPQDAFWAARQVMALTDEQIRAVVKTGGYSDPRAEAWVAECLIRRRNKIGKAFINQVLPLDFFAVRDGKLSFVDVSAKYNLGDNGPFTIRWAEFDNQTSTTRDINASGESVPLSNAAYLCATITGRDKQRTMKTYLRKQADGWQVVGLER